jgi:hypothetical protein
MSRTDSYVKDDAKSSYIDYSLHVPEYIESLHIRDMVSSIPQDTTFDKDIVDNGFKSKAFVKSQIEIHAKEYFKQWIGRVIEIENPDCFVALIEQLKGDGLKKIVRFNRHKVSMANLEQFEEGAVFYWTVGIFQNEKKMMVKRSEIRFQLLNAPSPIVVKEMEEEIGKVFDGITWLE